MVRRAGAAARATALVLAVVLLVVACGGADRVVSWRGLELTLPQGWVVFEKTETRLSVADAPRSGTPGDPGERTAAVYLTYRPDASPDRVREFVAEQGGTIISDESITIDGRPATRIVYTFDAQGIPLKEMVVMIPSRQLSILAQPTVTAGQTDGPQLFDAKRDELRRLLSSITFGAPVQSQ